LGRVGLGQGNPTRATTLFVAAKAQFEAAGLAMDPNEGPEYEKGLAAIRAALDEATFTAAWAERRCLTRMLELEKPEFDGSGRAPD